jgi:hypothetical protein
MERRERFEREVHCPIAFDDRLNEAPRQDGALDPHCRFSSERQSITI